jgi:small GTP-binding protein
MVQFVNFLNSPQSYAIVDLKIRSGMSNRSQIFPRVIFIGDSGVGKTSLIFRGTTDSFSTITAPTVGAGVTPMRILLGDRECRFHIWDTAGQEVYRSIVPLYFKLAVCAILVFSLTDPKSFESLPSWIDMLNRNTDHEVPVIIVGNKVDIEQRAVEQGTVKTWAASKDYPVFFTSAASGENVHTLFTSVAENYIASTLIDPSPLLKENSSAKRKSGCCS